jgi:hypothetical protein
VQRYATLIYKEYTKITLTQTKKKNKDSKNLC